MKATDTVSRPGVRDIAELAVMCALMVGLKEAMNALPNIHPIMLLIILCVRIYGVRALYPVTGFIVIEMLLYGFSIWTISYFYIWYLAAGLCLIFRKSDSRLLWAVLAALFGLFFGALTAIITLVMSGWRAAVAYWVSGVPYDIIHCVANFVIVFILQPPLYALITRVRKRQ